MKSKSTPLKYYTDLFLNHSKPLAFLDMDMLEKNIADINKRANGKKIRVASKSVRCIEVLKILSRQCANYIGLMSFTGAETLYLLENGFDNILLGYPTIDKKHIENLCPYIAEGKKIYFMADLEEHISVIQEIAKANNVIADICIDIDMSSSFPGLHFGVYRSAINSVEKLDKLTDFIKKCDHVRLQAIMGYEAQIAGVGENVKGKTLMNNIISFLKKRSIKDLRKRRKECFDLLIAKGFDIQLVNGGGTGSLESTTEEHEVTEVTVGSGFYSSHLFDLYTDFKHEPTVAFMLDITRHPRENIFTCAGGGYVASGATDPNKLPKPYLPKGMKLLSNEGAGEVQTPFVYTGNEKLKVGDAVIFRHSKAGEICERFNELHVVSKGKIIDVFKTYRGDGRCFL